MSELSAPRAATLHMTYIDPRPPTTSDRYVAEGAPDGEDATSGKASNLSCLIELSAPSSVTCHAWLHAYDISYIDVALAGQGDHHRRIRR